MFPKDEREIFAPLVPHGIADQVRNEFVTKFGCRLPPAGYHRALARAEQHQHENEGNRDHHHQCGIGKGDIRTADFDRYQFLDLELRQRTFIVSALCLSSQRLIPVQIRF
jgi:hypothetical protein